MEQLLSYKLGVRLYRGEKCFGPGIAELLRRVERTHSLRAAAAEMEMAYSKAWRIVKETERALGFDLLCSTAGGRNGGGAVLTEEGRAMLKKYDRFVLGLHAEARRLMDEIFN